MSRAAGLASIFCKNTAEGGRSDSDESSDSKRCGGNSAVFLRGRTGFLAAALRKEWKADIILLQVIKCIISLSIHYSILCPQ